MTIVAEKEGEAKNAPKYRPRRNGRTYRVVGRGGDHFTFIDEAGHAYDSYSATYNNRPLSEFWHFRMRANAGDVVQLIGEKVPIGMFRVANGKGEYVLKEVQQIRAKALE